MSEPDADIVAGCQRGERSAQQQLFELCHRQVYRLCARIAGQQDADDLSQQVFIRVYLSIGDFSGRSRFQTWLYRLTVNECLQHIRARRFVANALTTEPVISGDSARTDHEDLLQAALERLEPQLRAVFVLREIDRMRYHDLAKTLNLSEGTVASRLNRARKQMRQYLINQGWEVRDEL